MAVRSEIVLHFCSHAAAQMSDTLPVCGYILCSVGAQLSTHTHTNEHPVFSVFTLTYIASHW